MKKYFAFMLAAAAAVVACNKENLEKPADNNGNADVKYVDVKLSATIEGENGTKTSVNIGDDNKATVSWNANDQISVFDNASESTNNHNNAFTWKDGDFDGQLPKPGVSSAVYALYPYRTGATFEAGTGKIATKLFPDQNAAENTFANGVAIMAGKITDGTINFRNLCSHIKFKLTEENVKSITLMGNKNEALCGTFEITWNEGEPAISITKPETYVTVRNSEGTALTTGADYYITTLPVEFTEGFTIILSYMDGSQKIKSLNSDVKLERRKISPLSTPASFDEGRVNYFVQYNDGFDVTVGDVDNGGVTFSKTTNPDGVLVNSTKGNTTITKDGVYFLCAEESPTVSNYFSANTLIYCGVDSQKHSKLEIQRQFQPTENATLYFENLEIKPNAEFSNTTRQDFIEQAKSNLNTTFNSLIFDNCKIQLKRHLINFNVKEASIQKVTILNSDIYVGEDATQAFLFGCGNYESEINEINVRNNVIIGISSMTNGKIFHGPQTNVTNLYIYRNTFDKFIMPSAGAAFVGSITGNCLIQYNLCNETVLASSASNLISSNNDKKGEKVTKGTIINNYYFTTSEKNLGISSYRPASGESKAGSPVRLKKSPLSESWNPEKEVYGEYSFEAVDSQNTPSGALIPNIGAKRTDKKTTSTTSATTNSADYRNAQVDLGAF